MRACPAIDAAWLGEDCQAQRTKKMKKILGEILKISDFLFK